MGAAVEELSVEELEAQWTREAREQEAMQARCSAEAREREELENAAAEEEADGRALVEGNARELLVPAAAGADEVATHTRTLENSSGAGAPCLDTPHGSVDLKRTQEATEEDKLMWREKAKEQVAIEKSVRAAQLNHIRETEDKAAMALQKMTKLDTTNEDQTNEDTNTVGNANEYSTNEENGRVEGAKLEALAQEAAAAVAEAAEDARKLHAAEMVRAEMERVEGDVANALKEKTKREHQVCVESDDSATEAHTSASMHTKGMVDGGKAITATENALRNERAWLEQETAQNACNEAGLRGNNTSPHDLRVDHAALGGGGRERRSSVRPARMAASVLRSGEIERRGGLGRVYECWSGLCLDVECRGACTYM